MTAVCRGLASPATFHITKRYQNRRHLGGRNSPYMPCHLVNLRLHQGQAAGSLAENGRPKPGPYVPNCTRSVSRLNVARALQHDW